MITLKPSSSYVVSLVFATITMGALLLAVTSCSKNVRSFALTGVGSTSAWETACATLPAGTTMADESKFSAKSFILPGKKCVTLSKYRIVAIRFESVMGGSEMVYGLLDMSERLQAGQVYVYLHEDFEPTTKRRVPGLKFTTENSMK